jgi:hypothetical protein
MGEKVCNAKRVGYYTFPESLLDVIVPLEQPPAPFVVDKKKGASFVFRYCTGS